MPGVNALVSATIIIVIALIATAIYDATVAHTPTGHQIPAGRPVTVEGILRLVLLPRPGGPDIVEHLYYLEEGGRAYRLILAQLPTVANGTRVRVLGVLVVPSSWSGSQAYSFDGDIYVKQMTEI